MNKNTEVIHNARESLCNCTIELSGKNMLHARPSAKVKKIAD
jgi:hypothetical protein